MIANEREYRITLAEAERFAQALAVADQQALDLHPRLRQAMRDGLESQLQDLRAQLAEYEARRQGEQQGGIRKQDLVEEIASRSQLPPRQVRLAMDATFASIRDTINMVEPVDAAEERRTQSDAAGDPAGASATAKVQEADPTPQATDVPDKYRLVIDETLKLLYSQLYRLASAVAPTPIPRLTLEQLRQSSIGEDLAHLALVADEKLRADRDEVLGAIDRITMLLFWAVGAKSYTIPRDFWDEPLEGVS